MKTKFCRNLSGEYRFRASFWGRPVLQVEYLWHGIGPYEMPSEEGVKRDRYDWRDADTEDLLHPALRRLLPAKTDEIA